MCGNRNGKYYFVWVVTLEIKAHKASLMLLDAVWLLTVLINLCICVQSLSKQNSRTSHRDSSDTGDDRTPGEEIVGVCNKQQMAVSETKN